MPSPCPLLQPNVVAVENDHADQARDDARDPPRVQLFLARHRHHDHREQRRRGVQDRGQPARNIGLPDHDQRERQHVVEKPDGDERPPARQAARETDAVEPQQRQQHDRGERHAQEHHRQRRQFLQHHAVEEERPAPQDREQAEQRPVAGVDRSVVGGHGGSYLRSQTALFRRAGSLPPDFRMQFATRLFRPRHDLDHPAFVVVGHLGLCPGVGLDRGTADQRRVGAAGSRPVSPRRPHPCGEAPP